MAAAAAGSAAKKLRISATFSGALKPASPGASPSARASSAPAAPSSAAGCGALHSSSLGYTHTQGTPRARSAPTIGSLPGPFRCTITTSRPSSSSSCSAASIAPRAAAPRALKRSWSISAAMHAGRSHSHSARARLLFPKPTTPTKKTTRRVEEGRAAAAEVPVGHSPPLSEDARRERGPRAPANDGPRAPANDGSALFSLNTAASTDCISALSLGYNVGGSSFSSLPILVGFRSSGTEARCACGAVPRPYHNHGRRVGVLGLLSIGGAARIY